MRVRGRNLAESVQESFSKYGSNKSTCIFLSHISVDKKTTVDIGNYLMNAGFDIYLDINDDELQQAVRYDNANVITKCIEKGITDCSHIICLISNSTINSWWVPYEVGYAKKSDKQISTLFIKDVVRIPEYLQITTILKGVQSLNKYLEEIIRKENIYVLSESAIYKSYTEEGYLTKESSYATHPLEKYLHKTE